MNMGQQSPTGCHPNAECHSSPIPSILEKQTQSWARWRPTIRDCDISRRRQPARASSDSEVGSAQTRRTPPSRDRIDQLAAQEPQQDLLLPPFRPPLYLVGRAGRAFRRATRAFRRARRSPPCVLLLRHFQSILPDTHLPQMGVRNNRRRGRDASCKSRRVQSGPRRMPRDSRGHLITMSPAR